MKVIASALVVVLLSGCVSRMPLWMRPDARAQAANFCTDHGGLDKIQPRSEQGGGDYWVRCTDASMHLVSISAVKSR